MRATLISKLCVFIAVVCSTDVIGVDFCLKSIVAKMFPKLCLCRQQNMKSLEESDIQYRFEIVPKPTGNVGTLVVSIQQREGKLMPENKGASTK